MLNFDADCIVLQGVERVRWVCRLPHCGRYAPGEVMTEEQRTGQER